MAFDDAEPSPPAAVPAAHREPGVLLWIGIVLYMLVLSLIWWRSGERDEHTSLLKAKMAQLNTYITQTTVYWQLRGNAMTPAFGSRSGGNAIQVAELWQEVSRGYKDPHAKALALLNAAALYGVGDRPASARAAINNAARNDRNNAASYREFLPLYQSSPSPITMSHAARSTLDKISAGALIRTRNYLLAGDRPRATQVLHHGAMVGMRAILLLGGVILVGFGLAITALVIILVKAPAIKHTLHAMRHMPSTQIPWGIGTALIVVSVHHLLTIMLSFVLVKGAMGFGWTDTSVALVLSVLATILSALIVLGGFLMLLGRPPWAWRELGWHPTLHGARYGLLTLLLILPLFWIVSFISGIIFNGDRQINPLIEYLLSTRNLWLQFVMFFAAVIMAPLVEETFYRGILFRAMDERLPFWWAALLSGGLFSLAHGQPAAILPITLLGATFAFLTRRTRSLWASATAHAVYNGAITLLLLLISWVLQP